MDSIRVMLVDDHTLLRQGLRNMLEGGGNIAVIGEAENGETALAQIGTLSPEVVLMDITLPGMNGIETTRRIKEHHPQVQVLMLTMHIDDRLAMEAVEAGASAYLVKSIAQEELIKTIEVVHGGKGLIHPIGTERVMGRMVYMPQPWDLEVERPRLSSREKEVLRCLCDGDSNREIAQELFISEKTVKSHLRRIFKKLGVHDRSHAISLAFREGMTLFPTTIGPSWAEHGHGGGQEYSA
jgi:DNA-binding NarL/FixJ family response regulator